MKKKLFWNLMLLLLLVFCMDRLMGIVLKKFYYNEKQGYTFLTTYSVNHAKEDLLILGSSRASHHYVSQMFEDSLGIKAFNIGRDAMDINYHTIMLKSVLSRYTPKIVILDISLIEFQDLEDQATKNLQLVSALLPYISDNPIITNELNQFNKPEVIKAKLSMLYRFNSLLVPIVQHNLKIGNVEQLGYEPRYNTINYNVPPYEENRVRPIDSKKFNRLKEIIDLCENKGVKLYFVISPNRNKFRHNTIELTKTTLRIYNYNVWDYSSDPVFQTNAYFHDTIHLNHKGALLFSSMIIAKIRTEMAFEIKKRTPKCP